MNPTRQDRLKVLGLWPLWRLRSPAVAEAGPVAATEPSRQTLPPEVQQRHAVAGRPAVAESPDPAPGAVADGAGAAAVADPGVAIAPLPAEMDWPHLNQAIRTCNRCELTHTRTQAVPGVGDVHAEWLFIGEAPGANEDRQGEPFVGDAGKLLDALLTAIGLARGDNVFIANVLKSRPPGNRDPRPEEVAACLPFLQRQIDLIQPKLIVALGRIAAQSLLATDTPIGRLRGKVHRYHGVPLVVTYHPAYLLRNPLDKAKVWEDLVLARTTMQALKQ
jgi:uracil-DNA glycosylase